MKAKNLLTSILILIIILAGGYILSGKMQTQVQPVANIQSSSSMKQAFRYECEKGKSAFDVLDEKANVQFSESSFGKLVTSIDGKAQGDGKYWLYSINDKEATVGATAYICNGNEAIKWELK